MEPLFSGPIPQCLCNVYDTTHVFDKALCQSTFELKYCASTTTLVLLTHSRLHHAAAVIRQQVRLVLTFNIIPEEY